MLTLIKCVNCNGSRIRMTTMSPVKKQTVDQFPTGHRDVVHKETIEGYTKFECAECRNSWVRKNYE